LLAKRKKGVVAGKHYHKGTAASKNPELLFLIEGTVKLTLKDMRDDTTAAQEETHEVTAPVLLKIPPMVYHEVESLTDNVIYMEFNEEKSDFKFDTVWPADNKP